MKLYYAPGACSLAAHIVLHELGLPHETERVDLRAKRTAGGADFAAINPKGGVPALALDEGGVLTEGPAILQYLADRKPEAGLAPPPATLARYRLQEWLNFITSELHKGFAPLFKPDTPEDYKPIARKAIEAKLAYVERALGAGPHLMGEAFTLPDAYLFVMLLWADKFGFDLAAMPNLAAHKVRVAARPAVIAAMRHEGLLAP